GDTRESIHRSLHYLRDTQLYDEAQVFNLAVLPGTEFRQTAGELGLEYQARPPYYVLKTPTLELHDLYELMDEAEQLFDTEFDPLPEPRIHDVGMTSAVRPRYEAARIDLDAEQGSSELPPPEDRTQAFTLWLCADDFRRHADAARALIAQVLDENPHTTLQVLLEPGDTSSITPALLADLKQSCYRRTTYLDRFYSILPGPMKGSKRLLVLLDPHDQAWQDDEALAAIEEYATIV